MWDIIVQIFPYAIAYTIPILITALGALYCERSGIVNIGLDGFMIVGSFAGALTISKLQAAGVNSALWIGLISSCYSWNVIFTFTCFCKY